MKNLICAVTILAVSTVQAGTIFVDDDASLGGDGWSWDTAYRFFQDALADAAAGDEIRVAEGNYNPDQDEAGSFTPGDRAATFHLIDGIILMGGFAGIGAKNPSERDIDLYVTVLSGDLLGDDGPDFANNADNSFHVLTAAFTTRATVLDGFAITAGNANGANLITATGGGMRTQNASLTIIACTFRANHAVAGAGAYLIAGSPLLSDCAFETNQSTTGGGGLYLDNCDLTLLNTTFSGNMASSGGGILSSDNSNVMAADSLFEDNSATSFGGGISAGSGTSTMVIDCTFRHNTATYGGGIVKGAPTITVAAIRCSFIDNIATFGGAMYNQHGEATVTSCTFNGNSASSGGGMYNDSGDPAVTDCRFDGNTACCNGGGMYNSNNSCPTVTNCTFSGNTAGQGGGMQNLGNSSPTVINCTFSGNSASSSGGGMNNFLASPTVINCTFSGNSASSSGGGMSNTSSSVTVTNCVLWNNSSDEISGEATVSYSDVQGGFAGIGNIDADPLFVDPDNGDFRLLPGSPCIDAADNTAVPQDVTTDLDGNPRFLEIPETPDTGNGTLPIVDMGAFESLGGGCLAVTGQEVVCHADGTTFTVNIEGLNACTGGSTQVTFTASGGAVGQELCFTALVNDGGFCCSTEICVTIPDCTPVGVPSDLDGDGVVGIVDWLALLGAWGSCSDCGTPQACPADFDGDCSVGILDMLVLLGNWT